MHNYSICGFCTVDVHEVQGWEISNSSWNSVGGDSTEVKQYVGENWGAGIVDYSCQTSTGSTIAEQPNTKVPAANATAVSHPPNDHQSDPFRFMLDLD